MIKSHTATQSTDYDGVRAGYDRWAASYDDDDPSTLLDEPWLTSICRPAPGSRILDLACETGRYLRLLHPPFHPAVSTGTTVIGSDLSFGVLGRAQRQAEESAISWIQARANRLPFASECFDWALVGS